MRINQYPTSNVEYLASLFLDSLIVKGFNVVSAWASGPITSWRIEGETMETVTEFIFLDSRNLFSWTLHTVESVCSHEIKRCLLLGRKAITNLYSILKTKTSICTNVYLVRAVVFPVVMYGYDSWTIKNAQCQRIDASNCGAGEDSLGSHG